MRMSELLNEVRRFELDEGFSPREIKMAIGIASDPRYAKGNMTGAVNAIEKMKKGLSDHPQVAAVLKRQNEDLDEAMKGFKVEFGKGNDAGMAVYKDKKDAEAFAKRQPKPIKITQIDVKNANMFDDPNPTRKEAVSPAQQAAIAISKKERGEKPKDEEITEKFSDGMIDKLRKAYEPLRGKKIPPGPIMKIFDKIDSNKNALEQLYKADIAFVSTMAMSRLMLKHNYKADDINKLGKIRREGTELDEKKEMGFKVIMDSTHSLQQPNNGSGTTGGLPQLIEPMAKAAVAVGVDGFFIETHPDPSTALSDGANMLPLNKMEDLLTKLLRVRESIS